MIELSTLIHSPRYNQFAKMLSKGIVRGIRNRAFITTVLCYSEALSRELTGVEVGVKRGHLSRMLLMNVPLVKTLTMVDPWTEYPKDHPDRLKHGYAKRSQHRWDTMAADVIYKMGVHGCNGRFHVMRQTSVEAAAHMCALSERHDFVYIDARHQYPDVLEDCEAWWPVVKPGGFLSGDDYFAAGHMRRDYNGVGRAVEEFARRVDLPIIELHRNFFIQKPGA